ncbi:MAG: hypothetical protein QM791_16325 [Ferruginibacter sp.]
MEEELNPPKKTGYKWLPLCLAGVFVLYWLFTLAQILFMKQTLILFPRSVTLYRSVLKQDWRLFEVPREYNREFKLILRSRQGHATADTIDLVQYWLTEKRSHAPFNTYQYTFERLFFGFLNTLEYGVYNEKEALKKKMPGQADSFYLQQSSMITDTAQKNATVMYNLVSVAKYVIGKSHIDTSGKEYQLLFTQVPIPPQKPKAGTATSTDKKTIFVSAYKSF